MEYIIENCFMSNKVNQITLSDKVFVSDPSYSPVLNKYNKLIEYMRPGKYNISYQNINPGIITELVVQHSDFNGIRDYADSGITVGVDTGRCGIFDAEFFTKVNSTGSLTEGLHNKVGFMKAINKVKSKVFSINDSAVISQSGLGDGIYKVFTSVDSESGQIVGLMIEYNNTVEDNY